MGKLKGTTIEFLVRFRESKVEQIPLTLVLSLRSKCLTLVFLQLYIIRLSGWMSILPNSRV